MLIELLIKNELDQAHIFQYFYFESFQKNLQVTMYRFEYIYHDNNQDFLFQRFYIPFCALIINICNIFHI